MSSPENTAERIRALLQRLEGAGAERRAVLLDLGELLCIDEPDEAVQYLEQLTDDCTREQDLPRFIRAAYLLADIELRRFRIESAERYARLLDEATMAPGAGRFRLYAARLAGSVHEARDEYAAARQDFGRYLELARAAPSPIHERAALMLLGNVAALQGDRPAAADYYRQALAAGELEPNDADRVALLANLGWVQAQSGEWEQAFETLYRAIAAGEEADARIQTLGARNTLGELLLRRDRVDHAIRHFRHVVAEQLHGAWFQPLLNCAQRNLGRAYAQAGDLAAAGAAFATALDWARKAGNRREEISVCRRLAELTLAAGRLDDCRQWLDAAERRAEGLDLTAERAELLRVRGLLCAERGDADGARTCFDRALGLLEQFGDTYELARARLHYGKWLEGLGESPEATGMLEKAAQTFRRLSVVSEFHTANELLFTLRERTDREQALVDGLKALVEIRLEPVTLFERALRTIGDALGFQSGAVLVAEQPVVSYGNPDLAAAQAFSRDRRQARAGAALNIPVRTSDRFLGRIYLERHERAGAPATAQTLERVAGLLARPMEYLSRLPQCGGDTGPVIPGLVFRGVVGANPTVIELLRLVSRAADLNVPVLIRGESGTGKELVALALHESGRRRDGPFVPVNCAAVPDNLLEAEFFGVEKGAATGVAERRGKFELADGGTIFLDEVGDMSAELQARLLRVLQDRVIERVGGTERLRVDVRVVAATNQDIDALMRQGRFRTDLYYRLNAVDVTLPPLRERKEDIPLLVRHLVDRCNHEFGRDVMGVDDDVMGRFLAHDWPGNVRELEHAIERGVMLCSGRVVNADGLGKELRSLAADAAGPGGPAVPVRRRLADAERQLVQECLDRAGGDARTAAMLAGYSRAQFYRMLKRHNIEARRPRSAGPG